MLQACKLFRVRSPYTLVPYTNCGQEPEHAHLTILNKLATSFATSRGYGFRPQVLVISISCRPVYTHLN